MKRKYFLTKLLNLVLLAGVLLYYQSVASQRAAAVEANRAAVAEAQAFNEQIRQENEAALRAAAQEDAPDEPAEEESPYADGIYVGEGMGYGGVIRVEVTISDGAVAAVDVTAHEGEDPAYYMLAEPITQRVIDAQSADVDGATGATFSSAGLIAAISQALEQAGQ